PCHWRELVTGVRVAHGDEPSTVRGDADHGNAIGVRRWRAARVLGPAADAVTPPDRGDAPPWRARRRLAAPTHRDGATLPRGDRPRGGVAVQGWRVDAGQATRE